MALDPEDFVFFSCLSYSVWNVRRNGHHDEDVEQVSAGIRHFVECYQECLHTCGSLIKEKSQNFGKELYK